MVEDLEVQLLIRNLREGNFPIEFSREWVDDGSGGEKPITQIIYQDGFSIKLPYASEGFDSGMNFFNGVWKSANVSNTDSPYLH